MTRLPHPPQDVARACGLDYAPTPEQAAVIDHDLRPLLVIAGAGSGKTETMAARVVYLVANGVVTPDEVLGLTFTRKAATELGERIAERLGSLAASGLWTPPEDDFAATPTISTYHSYAGRLAREHGVRLGNMRPRPWRAMTATCRQSPMPSRQSSRECRVCRASSPSTSPRCRT